MHVVAIVHQDMRNAVCPGVWERQVGASSTTLGIRCRWDRWGCRGGEYGMLGWTSGEELRIRYLGFLSKIRHDSHSAVVRANDPSRGGHIVASRWYNDGS